VKNPVSDFRPLQSLEQFTQIRDFSPYKPIKSLRALEIYEPDTRISYAV
jgi:hypothetical protein